MATYTPNYNLRKIDLHDAPPDITTLNGNWGIIDEELHDIRGEMQTINNKIVYTRVVSISLPANSWRGTTVFSQTVPVSGITAKSKVDLQPDSTALVQLINDGVSALYIANNNGTLTAYAIGASPTTNLTIQATIMEVE